MRKLPLAIRKEVLQALPKAAALSYVTRFGEKVLVRKVKDFPHGMSVMMLGIRQYVHYGKLTCRELEIAEQMFNRLTHA